MNYDEVLKNVNSQISNVSKEDIEKATTTNKQSDQDILNMIALEIKRKGG